MRQRPPLCGPRGRTNRYLSFTRQATTRRRCGGREGGGGRVTLPVRVLTKSCMGGERRGRTEGRFEVSCQCILVMQAARCTQRTHRTGRQRVLVQATDTTIATTLRSTLAITATARLTTLGDSDQEKDQRNQVEQNHPWTDENKPKTAQGNLFSGVS